eukprot:COSAG06_NODE_2292_length_7145_cov_10.060176_2_plen_157_part_00
MQAAFDFGAGFAGRNLCRHRPITIVITEHNAMESYHDTWLDSVKRGATAGFLDQSGWLHKMMGGGAPCPGPTAGCDNRGLQLLLEKPPPCFGLSLQPFIPSLSWQTTFLYIRNCLETKWRAFLTFIVCTHPSVCAFTSAASKPRSSITPSYIVPYT